MLGVIYMASFSQCISDLYSKLMSGFAFLSQDEEEVLFMGRMYEPKRGEGKDGDALGRLWASSTSRDGNILNFFMGR